METEDQWNNLLACTQIFIALQAMEPMLRNNLRVKLTRSTESKIYFSIYAPGSTKAEYSTTIKAKSINNRQLLNALVDAIWQEVSARKLTIASQQ